MSNTLFDRSSFALQDALPDFHPSVIFDSIISHPAAVASSQAATTVISTLPVSASCYLCNLCHRTLRQLSKNSSLLPGRYSLSVSPPLSPLIGRCRTITSQANHFADVSLSLRLFLPFGYQLSLLNRSVFKCCFLHNCLFKLRGGGGMPLQGGCECYQYIMTVGR